VPNRFDDWWKWDGKPPASEEWAATVADFFAGRNPRGERTTKDKYAHIALMCVEFSDAHCRALVADPSTHAVVFADQLDATQQRARAGKERDAGKMHNVVRDVIVESSNGRFILNAVPMGLWYEETGAGVADHGSQMAHLLLGAVPSPTEDGALVGHAMTMDTHSSCVNTGHHGIARARARGIAGSWEGCRSHQLVLSEQALAQRFYKTRGIAQQPFEKSAHLRVRQTIHNQRKIRHNLTKRIAAGEVECDAAFAVAPPLPPRGLETGACPPQPLGDGADAPATLSFRSLARALGVPPRGKYARECRILALFRCSLCGPKGRCDFIRK
jgi:hypothetical protein